VTLIGQTVLDRYLVEDELGAGAMGNVYRGRHIKLPRKVAIKVLHPDLLHEPNIVARFHREAKGAAKLQHPNVVSVLDYGESKGHQIMVLELAAGKPLRASMAAPVARDRIVNLLHGILKGLDHAHASGIIHRDLKPENIIVESLPDGGEIPRIVDFGIAVLRDPESVAGGKLTASGQVLGTPIYMAPEQAQCEPFDERIDIFALGVILYEMLSGRQPFDGTAMEIAVANITNDLPPIAKRAPHVKIDPLLEALSRRLAARDAKKRVPSARDATKLLDLIESDRAAAALELGITDVARALDLIRLR
jgi:eukaryotic-like serine/threonine-protein kinase